MYSRLHITSLKSFLQQISSLKSLKINKDQRKYRIG